MHSHPLLLCFFVSIDEGVVMMVDTGAAIVDEKTEITFRKMQSDMIKGTWLLVSA